MGQFASAKQFAYVGALGFVVKLNGPASGLMQRYSGSGLVSLGIGLCFESGSGLCLLFLPDSYVQFLDEVFQVQAVRGIEKQFVFNFFPLGAGACNLQRRIPETFRYAFTV